MTSTSSISVVTCSYQHGKFIDATIRSVLEQQYPGLEYIIMDGGSSDGTLDILKRYSTQVEYWVSEPDDGQTDALIKGFKRCRGEIMGWLCSDDLLLPGALQVVADFFAEHPHVEAVYGDAIWIDGKGELIRQKREIPFSQFLMRFDHNYVPQPSMFWRRSVFERVGGLNPRFDLAMDADLWDRFAQSTRIAHIDKFLSCMRYYPEQKTRALRSVGEVETMEIASRSRLGRVMPLRSTLHYAARVTRLLVKLVTGRYVPAVPADILTSLERFRINDDGL
jgi:glycosyltransferase involved in cell wall biosynthesis